MDHDAGENHTRRGRRMMRPDADYLNEITSVSEEWRRRCNGKPEAGIPMSRRGLRIVLASSSDVSANGNGVISWSGAGRCFTAEPISA